MAEFDTLDDLGFINDKQFICGCRGFLENNGTRDICERFISDGGHFLILFQVRFIVRLRVGP